MVSDSMKVIIQLCEENRVKRLIVTSSTATIVGNAFKSKVRETLYTENDIAPIEGVDSYGLSKIR